MTRNMYDFNMSLYFCTKEKNGCYFLMFAFIVNMILIIMNVRVCCHMCAHTYDICLCQGQCVEVRGQLCRVHFLLPLSHGFQGLNSRSSGLHGKGLCLLNHLTTPSFNFLGIFWVLRVFGVFTFDTMNLILVLDAYKLILSVFDCYIS